MTATMQNQILRFMLRLIGTSSLFALIFVFVPYWRMDSIHSSLGMGSLPDKPVVGYLARSLSAFYALMGGLLWVVSFDLQRHRPIVLYLGWALTLFGILLLGIDWYEEMPLFWKLWEGPFVTAFGLAVLYFGRRIGSVESQA